MTAAFIKLLKMGTELVTENSELFKLFVIEASGNTLGIFFSLRIYFSKQSFAFITERNV